MADIDPAATLRRAAELAPQILAGPLGETAAAWLIAEAGCHEAVPEVSWAAAQMVASVASNIADKEVPAPNFTVTVSTLDSAVAFAEAVLALAEQQQARPAYAWRVGDDPGADRALMLDAVEYVINRQLGSTSALQRNIRVGFAKAGQLMDLLETWGVVGPAYGSMAREVLVPKEQLHDLVEAIRGGVK